MSEITRRDLFAAAALAGHIAKYGENEHGGDWEPGTFDSVWRAADAMLAHEPKDGPDLQLDGHLGLHDAPGTRDCLVSVGGRSLSDAILNAFGTNPGVVRLTITTGASK